MATPRAIYTLPIAAGTTENSVTPASVPTLAGHVLVSLQLASCIWTDFPTSLASPFTASQNDISAAPADGPFISTNPFSFRWRDVGAAGFITLAFYEGAPDQLGL